MTACAARSALSAAVSRAARPAAMAALALALAGCATTRVATVAAGSADIATARLAQREREVAAETAWGLEGRVAVSNGRDAGSGRLEWRQAGARFDVELTAPITRQGWRLSGEPGRAVLDGLPGGPRQGTDAEALLLQATGWDIPLRALPAWVRGVPADPASAVVGFGADARPAHIDEAGWSIDYAWPADAAAVRPARIEARRGDARVRLVVDRWTDGAP